MVRNKYEAEFERKAALEGWVVTKRGWPDFICRRGLDVMAVEVKETDWLSAEQDATLRDLYAVGIRTFVWTVAGGFKPYPENLVDRLPSRMELLRENDRLMEKVRVMEKEHDETRDKVRLLMRALRYQKTLTRGKAPVPNLEKLMVTADAVDI